MNEDIIEVAAKRNLKIKDILSKSRKRKLFYARMEIAQRLRDKGYIIEDIASILNRDHSTIVYYLYYAKKEVNLQC